MNLVAEFAEARVATRRADTRIPKHTHIQAVLNPSEVATCSGTPNSRIVTRPEVSGRTLRASRSVQESREWARSARESDADSIARLAEVGGPSLDLDALIAQELDTGASVDPTTPVLPVERRIPNDKRMEQDAHRPSFRPLPLALLAQRAGAATANAGGIHHAQASISFSAVFVRNQLLASRAPKRPIELASPRPGRKSGLLSEAGSGSRWTIPGRRSGGGRTSGCLRASRWESRSKLGGAHRHRLQLVPQFESDIPDLLADDLPDFLSPGRVAAPAVGVLLAVFIS